jgi:hypothetical protein
MGNEPKCNCHEWAFLGSYECPAHGNYNKYRKRQTTHTYRWKNDNTGYDTTDYSAYPPKRPELFGRRCSIIARGKKNSILVEFENGQREIVSRNSVRKV